MICHLCHIREPKYHLRTTDNIAFSICIISYHHLLRLCPCLHQGKVIIDYKWWYWPVFLPSLCIQFTRPSHRSWRLMQYCPLPHMWTLPTLFLHWLVLYTGVTTITTFWCILGDKLLQKGLILTQMHFEHQN